MVERCVRDAEAAGSNPVASTKRTEPTLCRFCSFLSRRYCIYSHERTERSSGGRATNLTASGGRNRENLLAQRSKFIGAPSRNELRTPQEGCAGSNPVASTMLNVHNGLNRYEHSFFMHISVWSRFCLLFFVMPVMLLVYTKPPRLVLYPWLKAV